MFFRQFIFILLFSAVFVCTAHAKDLTIDQLRQACIADNTQDQKNCEAYLRGVGERLQTQKIYFDKSCRKTPVSAEDIQAFNDFIAKDNIKPELPANIYVFKYWSRDEGKIPCLETKGFWSVQDLQEMCGQDYSGASPCKFYIESLTEFAKMQFTLAEQTFVCPGGSAVPVIEDWFYAIDMIIALSFRLQSPQARDVRRQFTKILGEFAVKGFILDDERFKNGSPEAIDALEAEAASMVKH